MSAAIDMAFNVNSINPATSLWHEALIRENPKMNTQDYYEDVMPRARTFDGNRPKSAKAIAARLKRLQAEQEARERSNIVLVSDEEDLLA